MHDVADISCMAHTLQLVLRDGLFTQSSVENACEESTARKTVSHFKRSEQACRHLVECQQSVSDLVTSSPVYNDLSPSDIAL